MSAGRPHQAVGNGSRRWMITGRPRSTTESGLQAGSSPAQHEAEPCGAEVPRGVVDESWKGLTPRYAYLILYVMNSTHDHDDLVWKALAHATRRRILDVLFESPSSTGEVVAALAMDRHVVMAHLAVLREADLVTTEKRGRVRINHLNVVPIQQIHHRWTTPTSAPWAAALIAVRDEMEAASKDLGIGAESTDDWKQSG